MSVSKPFSVVSERNTKVRTATEREAELLGAAAHVFAEKGFHETKISDIVAHAGVAQGTFYLYFKNKNDILFRLISNCCARVLDKLAQASLAHEHVKTGQDYRAAGLTFYVDLFHMLEAERPILRLILTGPSGVDPAIDKMLGALREALTERVKSDLELGISAGYLRKCHTAVVAEALVGMVYHLAFERFVRGRDLGVDLECLAAEIVALENFGISGDAK